jgi:N-acetylglucosaminyldiphosphoundecaprenol N-acetyl-beta-D-mannosaminyltransferase
MATHVGRLTAPVLLGVGAAFDIRVGLLPQAAKCMQAAVLEWLYRLAREPRQLWRRYLHNNARFLLANIRHRPSMLAADW